MIRKAEGTASPNGYRYLFGSRYNKEKLLDSYVDHPRILFPYTDKTGKQIKTSAAGAYQITRTTWDALRKKIDLPSFSPDNQDKAAIQLIKETGALPLIEGGKLEAALAKVRKIWASLPASGNNQPERSLADVKKWYLDAGGTIA
jgi:lysozyme